MKNLELKVKGMMCQGCENRIVNALKRVDNVENVSANFKTGIITIEFLDKLDENLVKEKIENLGFEVIK